MQIITDNATTFEEYDQLLKRNWFVDEQNIHDLLRTANDDIFWKIFENRANYATRIRKIIAPNDYVTDYSLIKNKVLELEDDDFEEPSDILRRRIKLKLKQEWEEYVQTHNPTRPDNDPIDGKIRLKDQEIRKEKQRQEEYMSKRKNGDPLALRRFQKILDGLESEKRELEIEKEKMDKIWLSKEEQRFPLRK